MNQFWVNSSLSPGGLSVEGPELGQILSWTHRLNKKAGKRDKKENQRNDNYRDGDAETI